MTPETVLQEAIPNVSVSIPEQTVKVITEALNRLPRTALPELLQFIEFLGYKFGFEDDPLDDGMIWKLVEAEQTYRREHPEDVVLYKSVDELAAALGIEK